MFCVFKFYIIPYSYYNFIVSDKVTKKDLPTAKKIKKKHLELLQISLKNCNFAASLKKNAMEFTGKIIAILQPRGGVAKSGNEWKAQEYVMGEELTVSFDVDARQWQDRWFNSIRAWKVERVSATAPAGAPGAPVPPPAPTAAPEFLTGDAKDDLPF